MFDSVDSVQDKQDTINEQIVKNAGMNQDMMKALIDHASGSVNKKKAPRLAFAEDPYRSESYAGIYKTKRRLLPNNVIKQIRSGNFLIASILRARGNHISLMGHPRKDRFDVGIELSIKPEYKSHIEPEQMVKIQERMDRALKIFMSCGHTDGLQEEEKMSLPEYLYVQVQNGLSFGYFASENIFKDSSNQDFHRFRPVDAGTIYKAVRKGEGAEGVRATATKALEFITGEKIDAKKMEDGEYSWVQAVDGTPKQAFTAKEMLVYNMYPATDIEFNGYPLTPLDTVMTSVTTHMSIEVYNKLYFQNGRAARGMLVINSDEIDQSVIEDIKQQYNASINNVTNSFRTPIFGVGKEDTVNWVSTTPTRKDGEFQFLFDQTTRNILSAFNISPDELPGFGHLSKGTNQQSLSESNNEYKLAAARDSGIRPLIMKIQDFLNEKLFPVIDKELSQLCNIEFAGFDAETKQQESVRLQQDMPIHMTYDEVMEETEKEQVGPAMGGSIPFNEHYRAAIDSYQNVGKAESFFLDSPAAWVDPILRFRRDQFWFQNMQMLAEMNPNAVQAYYATRKGNMETLKMLIKDYLDEDDLV